MDYGVWGLPGAQANGFVPLGAHGTSSIGSYSTEQGLLGGSPEASLLSSGIAAAGSLGAPGALSNGAGPLAGNRGQWVPPSDFARGRVAGHSPTAGSHLDIGSLGSLGSSVHGSGALLAQLPAAAAGALQQLGAGAYVAGDSRHGGGARDGSVGRSTTSVEDLLRCACVPGAF